MSTILLTGGTGTVGSCLAPLLVKKGHQVLCLVRPKDGQDPRTRVREIFGKEDNGIRVIEGDVTLPQAGISNSEREELKGRVHKLVHCAASIKFDERLAPEIRQVNVDGTKTVLLLAEELGIPEFHFMSTAYVAGDADHFTESDLDIGQTPRNIYERTKLEAEQEVRNWRKGKYSIQRLGILVGDSKTGYTPNFTGYYRPFETFWQMRQWLERKEKTELKRYEAEGIAFADDGTLTLPLCLPCSPVSTVNLVPRDWAAQILADLIAISATGQTFHIVHSDPPQVRWLTDVSLTCLGISGYYYGARANCDPNSLLGKLQRGIERGIRDYLPYIIHEPRFDSLNTIRMLGAKYSPPPQINKTFLTTLLRYAKSVNFGKKIRT